MFVACWSPKGGSGTTVVAVLVALVFRRAAADGALLVDVAGDVPAALGVAEPTGPGLAEWLAAASELGHAELSRLEVEVGAGLRLLPRGSGSVGGAGGSRAEALVDLLGRESRPVVADCGRADRSPGRELAAAAPVSLCVLRPCYLALRRALEAGIRPTGVVLVREPGRALQRRDVEEVLGVPVWAELPYDEALARSVDAGLLAARPPRAAERTISRALAVVVG